MSTLDPTSPDFVRPGYGNCHSLSPTCPVQYTIYGSLFNLPAMLFFTLLFSGILVTQLFYAYRYRTDSFSSWIILGAVFQTIGSASRVGMHYNPWSMALLSLQICCLLWGPTLVAAGISIAFKHMVHYVGTQYSILPPKWIPWVFVGTDIVSISIQGVGGIIASVSSGKGNSESVLAKVGEGMMIGGVVFQILNMLVCSAVMLLIWRRYQVGKRKRDRVSGRYDQEKETDAGVQKRFSRFARAAALSFACVLIRCCYRVAEMAGGWANPIMRDETSFLVLDPTMIAIALLALSIFHPGKYLPVMRKSKRSQEGEADRFPEDTGKAHNEGSESEAAGGSARV